MSNLTRLIEHPADLFAQMRKDMDHAMHHWFSTAATPPRPGSGATLASAFTAFELRELDGEYVVKMDVPGMNENDLKVRFSNDTLVISGERKQDKPEGKANEHYTERSYGAFSRTISLPPGIKASEIRARYKDGVMEVRLPKAQRTEMHEVKVEAAP